MLARQGGPSDLGRASVRTSSYTTLQAGTKTPQTISGTYQMHSRCITSIWQEDVFSLPCMGLWSLVECQMFWALLANQPVGSRDPGQLSGSLNLLEIALLPIWYPSSQRFPGEIKC